ncbi:UNVERIFIED_CONTAM: hypothetical protein Sradi_2976000 [Sesamum radiatum]|uniref:Uncharacterized protein n=1 Tax=Sesamum radiatum TaxID=300843 RepID=A0AAW2S055_SESRA
MHIYGTFHRCCPTLREEPTEHADAIGGFSGQQQRRHDPFSNTYNPGWRDHPNLRYGNQQQNSQRPPYQPPQTNPNSSMPLEDIVKTLALSTQQFQQETRSSIQNLESQISQLASSWKKSYIRIWHYAWARTTGKIRNRARNSLQKAEKPDQVDNDTSKVEVNIPLIDAIKQIPRYAKFLKEFAPTKVDHSLKLLEQKLMSITTPTLELKELPKHLKYAYLGENETLPVIISSKLSTLEEEKLIRVLREFREAIVGP